MHSFMVSVNKKSRDGLAGPSGSGDSHKPGIKASRRAVVRGRLNCGGTTSKLIQVLVP